MPKKKSNDKIIRVKFTDDWTMMFGNSYKPWEMQLEEYLLILKRKGELDDYMDVTVSDSKWVDWGGLKWCAEENFQHQLNREGCQSDEPDNLNPRKYEEMVFYRDSSVTKKVNKMFDNLKANIY